MLHLAQVYLLAMRDPAQITAEIESLRRAMATGVKTFRHGDREVTLRSQDEVDASLARLEAELQEATSGVTAASRSPSIFRIRSGGRGL